MTERVPNVKAASFLKRHRAVNQELALSAATYSSIALIVIWSMAYLSASHVILKLQT